MISLVIQSSVKIIDDLALSVLKVVEVGASAEVEENVQVLRVDLSLQSPVVYGPTETSIVGRQPSAVGIRVTVEVLRIRLRSPNTVRLSGGGLPLLVRRVGNRVSVGQPTLLRHRHCHFSLPGNDVIRMVSRSRSNSIVNAHIAHHLRHLVCSHVVPSRHLWVVKSSFETHAVPLVEVLLPVPS